MKWKYLDSDVVYRINDNMRTIHGVVRGMNNIVVTEYARDEMERLFGFPLRHNVEIVAKIVGVRLPPNQWCRVIGVRKKNN